MDFEASLLRSVVSDPSAYSRFKSLRPSGDDFDDPAARRVISFVEEYVSKHEGFPSVDAISMVARIKFPEEIGASENYLIEQFVNRRLFRRTNTIVADVQTLLRKNDPRAAFDALRAFVEKSGGDDSYSPPVSLLGLGGEVLRRLSNANAGDTGIAFPWPTLNRATNGMYPGSATLYVARPGMGKTFVAVIQARRSWLDDRRVLVISPEMDKEEIAERFFVIDSKVSYSRVVQGSVAELEMKKIRDRVAEISGMSGMWILDGEEACNLGSIESAIRLVQPELVVIDAGYMLEAEGRSDKDKIDFTFNWTRKVAKKLHVPMVMFHQLSRDAEKGDKDGGGARMGTIALTDRGAWDFYNIFALEQDKDMAADHIMRIRKLKIRRPAFAMKSVDVRWDFNEMNFDEIDKSNIGVEKPEEKKSKFHDDEDDGVPF